VNAPIFLLSGTPASGKSSVTKTLMQRFARGVHIAVDDLREMVVSGIAHPMPEWTPETARQFSLARGNAVLMARRYSSAGFAVAIDDVFSQRDFVADYALHFTDVLPHRVLLLPRLEVALRRNAERSYKDFHPDILVTVIEHCTRSTRQWIDAAGW
jgi:chloramphenicol 3-O-phosphotransferase